MTPEKCNNWKPCYTNPVFFLATPVAGHPAIQRQTAPGLLVIDFILVETEGRMQCPHRKLHLLLINDNGDLDF